MKKFLKRLKYKLNVFEMPDLTIKPVTIDNDEIIEMCRIKEGENKGKIDLRKYAEITQELADINYELAESVNPFRFK